MSKRADSGKITKGGSFVIADVPARAIATPEDYTEEQRMFAETTRQFIDNEIIPRDAQIEKLDYELTAQLMRQAGDLGLLGADVPEPYGGLGLDIISSTLISETLAGASSFALSVGAHAGIGTLPIVYFGTPEQKRKYLPDLASGMKIAAYCLTEPASGSDALGARTTAVLNAEGTHYMLNGSKCFITNAAFAHLFIVYAKVSGTDFTAFIVERTMAGLTVGPEEKKMGIKGSSTCPLFFENVAVPVENVLGVVGKGHLIAFNILNIGRFKLAAGCLGGSKAAIAMSAAYANTRKQFGRPIAQFPLVGAKLADMNIRTFVLESMVYRTAGLIDEGLRHSGAGDVSEHTEDFGSASAKAIAEYAIECSINKVFGSETLNFVADEGVQIHGGYGYIQEYGIERIYRDSRINRIFEGTNEINRLLIPGTLFKKAMKGELPLLEQAEALQQELLQLIPGQSFNGILEQERHMLSMAKKIALMIGGRAVQKYRLQVDQEQEVLAALADMIILVYALESAILRAGKLLGAERGDLVQAQNAVAMTQVFACEAFERIESLAKQSVVYLDSGDEQRIRLSLLKKLTRTSPVSTVQLKRSIAEIVIRNEKYSV